MAWAPRARERGRRGRGVRRGRGRARRVGEAVEGEAEQVRAVPAALPVVRRGLGPAPVEGAGPWVGPGVRGGRCAAGDVQGSWRGRGIRSVGPPRRGPYPRVRRAGGVAGDEDVQDRGHRADAGGVEDGRVDHRTGLGRHRGPVRPVRGPDPDRDRRDQLQEGPQVLAQSWWTTDRDGWSGLRRAATPRR